MGKKAERIGKGGMEKQKIIVEDRGIDKGIERERESEG